MTPLIGPLIWAQSQSRSLIPPALNGGILGLCSQTHKIALLTLHPKHAYAVSYQSRSAKIVNFPAPNEETYLIDAIEDVRFSRESAPTANFHAIDYGPIGLELIARNVWQSEQRLKNTRIVVMMPQTTAEDGVLTSYFYWFAVTLVNHARLVGMLSYLHKNGLRDASLMDMSVRKEAVESTNAYVKATIPDVLTWRHKIGAHYAFTDPRSDDTIHDLQQSVMMNVAFVRLRWRACGMRWGNAAIPEWSITEEMERLTPRFWPNFKFQ